MTLDKEYSIINFIKKFIQQSEALSPREQKSHQIPYRLSINQKATYSFRLFGKIYSNKECIIISYEPSNPIRNKRVVIETSNKERIFVKDTDVIPLNQKNIDTRNRLYIQKNSPYHQLHSLLDQYILCYPNDLNKSIKTTLFSDKFYTIIKPIKAIAIPNHGFIYLCRYDDSDSGNVSYLAHIIIYELNGEEKAKINYILDDEDYLALFSVEEVQL